MCIRDRYNTLAGIIRALGDSRTPVYFLILSSLLNIVLDLFFIVQIGTGTAGAAYATVIAQAVSGILCLIYMKKKFDILKMHREETRISTYPVSYTHLAKKGPEDFSGLVNYI